MQERNLYF